MSTPSEKAALKFIKAKHLARYSAPFGKRKCNFEISEKCLKVSRELNSDGVLQWKGLMCKPCLKVKHQRLHAQRMVDQGGKKPRGRPRKVEN